MHIHVKRLLRDVIEIVLMSLILHLRKLPGRGFIDIEIIYQLGSFRVNRYSAKFHFSYSMNLSELITFYFPWNHSKTIGFLIISEWIEIH